MSESVEPVPTSTPFPEPLAITGIGCRFPGKSHGPNAFFDNLLAKIDAITEVPKNRWDHRAYYDPEPGRPGRTCARWGGFIEAFDEFDPKPFGLSPREAPHVDPQQRLLLEAAWEALEDAGEPIQPHRRTQTGVFVGISTNDYNIIQARSPEVDPYTTPGTVMSIAANRISYCLNLTGPSVAVDTACSSSLVALHAGCRAVASGECDQAIVAGVNCLILPYEFVAFSSMTMLAKDGRCRAFDAKGSGFVRAEGVGAMVIKPISKAIANRDRIYALIRATGVNQDGRTPGMTVPSQTAQAALIRQVCAQAEVAPEDVRYVEAHGTGTPVGDPIEARALGESLSTDRKNQLLVGSVKTNIGHLEAGAGMAGLIKLAMSLHRGVLPPNLHFEDPNPNIDFDGLRLRVLTEATALDDTTIGGINSFGFGGTNGHALLESPPKSASSKAFTLSSNESESELPPESEAADDRAELVVLSAKSESALKSLAQSHVEFLTKNSDLSLHAAARTLALRRGHHDHRLTAVAETREELQDTLSAFVKGESRAGLSVGQVSDDTKLAFVFSGQGPQWWGMGRQLYEKEPVFRAKLEECHAALESVGGWSLLDELLADEEVSKMRDTKIAQPSIFALQVSLSALWKSLGIQPSAVVGHSVGEVAAAHEAGSLDLREAMRVIYHRGRTMSHAAGGRMLAAGIDEKEAESWAEKYRGRVDVAALNSPNSVTLAGEGAALTEIAQVLEGRGAFARFLQVPYAFHSFQMDPVQPELMEVLGGLSPQRARLPLVSTVAGALTDGTDLGADYWWRNVRRTVRFAPAITVLADLGFTTFLELAPHPVLSGSIGECLAARGKKGLAFPSLRRGNDERRVILGSLGGLHTKGFTSNFSALFRDEPHVTLPTYAWQKERFWNERNESLLARLEPPLHPLLLERLSTAEPSFDTRLDPKLHPWLRDHKIEGRFVFPGAGYLELALAAARTARNLACVELENVELPKAMFLPVGEEPAVLKTEFRPTESRFSITSTDSPGSEPNRHAHGSIREIRAQTRVIDLAALKSQLDENLELHKLYERFEDQGLGFGPAFRTIREAHRGPNEALGRIVAETAIHTQLDRYLIHPALLDGCLQVVGAALPSSDHKLQLPVAFRRLALHVAQPRTLSELWCHARVTQKNRFGCTSDLEIADAQGSVLITIEGFETKAVNGLSGDRRADLLYELEYERLETSFVVDDRNEPVDAPSDSFDHKELLEQAKNVVGGLLRTTLGAELNADLCARLEVGLPTDEYDAARNRALAEFPVLLPEISLIDRARKALELSLRRNEPLPPPTDASWLQALEDFESSSFFTYSANRAVARLVRGIVDRSTEGQSLRCLELEASTGAVTSRVLPELPPHRSSYTLAATTPEASKWLEPKIRSFPFAKVSDAPTETYDVVILSHGAKEHPIADLIQRLSPGGRLIAVTNPHPTPFERLLLPDRTHDPRLPRTWQEAGLVNVRVVNAGNRAVVIGQKPLAGSQMGVDPVEASHTSIDGLSPSGSVTKLETNGHNHNRWHIFSGGPGTRSYLLAETIRLQSRGSCQHGDPGNLTAFLASDAEGALNLCPLDDSDALPPESLPFTLRLTQSVANATSAKKLIFVTEKALPAGEARTRLEPKHAVTVGFARTIPSELKRIPFALVDLGNIEAEAEIRQLLSLLGEKELVEDELAIRGHARYAARFVRQRDKTALRRRVPADKTPFRLEARAPGSIEQLVPVQRPRRSPGPGEVEIQVHAAGLNFRDVMKTLAIYPGSAPDANVLGDEGAGVVVRVGPDVTRFREGDAVIGIGGGYFGSFVTVSQDFVVAKPQFLSFEDAATVPVAFMTAWYALHELGRMRRGDKVLVHAATGGVGLAAVLLAQEAGAEIFATAGSPDKRDFLKRMGVSHVLDSRTLDFADQIRTITDGRGVDLVLNSLAGDAIEKSMACLGQGGRFLEIGKRDIYGDTRISLRPFRNAISYFAIDLGATMVPEFVRPLLARLEDMLRRRSFHPLPFRAFPVGEAQSAFRYMTAARQIGKIVLSLRHETVDLDPRTPASLADIREDRTYLITGGTKGFGFQVAELLVGAGARHLVLTSRTGRCEPDGTALTERWRRAGVHVELLACDVTDEDSLDTLFARFHPPLGGVFHSAMVLDDGLISDLTVARFTTVLGPKALGARHLARRVARLGGDAFIVFFSSISSIIGNAGQASYNAANAVLDALAHRLRYDGVPAISVNFGPLAETGIVTRQIQLKDHFARMGLVPLPTKTAQACLSKLLEEGATQTAVLDAHWSTWAETSAGGRPKYSRLVAQTDDASSSGEDLRTLLSRPSKDRQQRVESYLRDQIGGVLRTSALKLDVDRPLTELGLDSLMAVELIHRVEVQLGVRLPTGKFLGGASINKMSGVLMGMLGGPGVASAVEVTPASPDRNPVIETDVVLPPELAADGRTVDSALIQAPRTLLVTGPLEILGSHIIAELLTNTPTRVLYLSDASSTAAAEAALAGRFRAIGLDPTLLASRTEPVLGSLAEPRLGLSEHGFGDLAERIDAIVHNGARINHVETYAQLRAANVLGTIEALRLASMGRLKPLHYVSGVSSLTAHLCRPDQPILESDPLTATGRLAGGYAESRWVSEKLIARAAERGLPITLSRPGLQLLDIGEASANVDDLSFRALHACLDAGAVPLGTWSVFLTPMSFVRSALTRIFRSPEALGRTFHVVPSRQSSLLELGDDLKACGYHIEQLPRNAWEARVKSTPAVESARAGSSANPLLPYVFFLPPEAIANLGDTGGFPTIDDRETRSVLRDEVRCRELDRSVLLACFRRFIEVGVWPSPLEQSRRFETPEGGRGP